MNFNGGGIDPNLLLRGKSGIDLNSLTRSKGKSRFLNKFDNPLGKMTSDLQGQLEKFTGNLERIERTKERKRRNQFIKPDEQGDIVPQGYGKGQLNQFDENQEELYQSLFDYVDPDSYLARLSRGDEDLFDEMEAPALRQFSALQSNLANRFSGQGMGHRKGSSFQNAQGDMASNFAQELQANRQNLMRQGLLDLQGLSRELLGQRPNEKFLVKKQYPNQKQNQSGDILGGLLSGAAGGAAGFGTAGIPGAVAGAGAGFYKGYRGGF